MRFRTFGRLGWQVGEVGYGMWGMGGWSGSDDKESIASLELAASMGVNFYDTAQAYGDGRSEQLLARLVARHSGKRIYNATKVPPKNRQWPSRRGVPVGQVFPRAYVRQYVDISRANLGLESIDLLQLHNVRDPKQSLAQFRAWKAQGVCRYIGITSTFHRDFAAVEAVLAREKPDFVQIDYSLDNREAQARILALAAEHKAGVLTALPFGRGRLFRAVRGKEIPAWAQGFAESWAQFFLKFLLADERVTAVIPGTSNPAHMADNLGAMRGRLPDEDERKRMVSFIDGL